MDFTLIGTDPRYFFLKQRFEADGHTLAPDSRHIIAPPAARTGVPYYADPVYVTENAALTAEGALELIMRRSDRALPELAVLVAGFGRIGSMLAEKLSLLGAEVTVAARSAEAREKAEFGGHNSVDINYIPDGFDVLVNTVPAPILRGSHEASLCIDLASSPGGWNDHTPVLKVPGLPGLYAPRSAANVMAEAIYRVLEVDIK